MVSIAEGGMLQGIAVNGVLCHAEFLKWLESCWEDVSWKVLIRFIIHFIYKIDQLLNIHLRLFGVVGTGQAAGRT